MKVTRTQVNSDFSLEIKSPTGIIKVPASVPGSIHTDLMAAGLIRDIRIDGDELEQEWIRNADSTFKSRITHKSAGQNTELRFHGLDTLASVYVNGELRLQTENMHRSYAVDISSESESFDLQIDFKAPLPEALNRQKELGIYPNPYDMPYNYFRKMACSFGWDWGPITVTSGIWKPIEIVNWDEGILDEVVLVSNVVDGVPTLEVLATGRGRVTKCRIRVQGPEVEFEDDLSLNSSSTFKFKNAQIWHPRGFGESTLYEVSVLLMGESGEVLDSKTKRVGFRSVSLDQTNSGDRQQFAIQVNGQRVWARGVNWIPDDPFPHRVSREQYREKILGLFDVEVNAIRVWGGGIYESDDFYDVCDELGIIVWQDFLFACAAYPETPTMFSEVEAEAREAIKRLSSHPSLVLWCGGNECLEGFQHWDWKEPLAGKAWGSSFYFELLPKLLAEIDGSRAYIPGSPFSTLSDDVKDFKSGTNHIWDVWNDVGYQRYEEYSPSFAAEFGYNGPASWSTLTVAIAESVLDSRDLKLAEHQKAFFGMDKIAAGLKREFSRDLVAGPDWYFAAQLVQARAVEVGLKHFRSLYQTCSGSMLWQYNDMWPALSWAVLDVHSSRKLAWYSMREAYRPRLVHLSQKDRNIYLINDTFEKWEDELKLVIVDTNGKVIASFEKQLTVDERSIRKFEISDFDSGLNFAEIDGFIVVQFGTLRASRRMLDTPINELNPQNLSISSKINEKVLTVSVTALDFTAELCLLPELILGSQNTVANQRLTLLPNESAVVEIVTGSKAEAEKLRDEIGQIVWSLNRLVSGY